MFKLSQFGFSKEEVDMLSNRLYPQVNEEFFKQIAKKNNIQRDSIEQLDYVENAVKTVQFSKTFNV